MHNKIEHWIDQTLETYSSIKKSCICFENEFKDYFPADYLRNSFFVVVDKLPKPDLPELRSAGFGEFLDTEYAGITYKDTYFITAGYEQHMHLHFHELVHVMQWKILGAQKFIARYLQELTLHGYDYAPLELMAYGYQHRFQNNEALPNLLDKIEMQIKWGEDK